MKPIAGPIGTQKLFFLSPELFQEMGKAVVALSYLDNRMSALNREIMDIQGHIRDSEVLLRAFVRRAEDKPTET